jgi:hypothetical protein
LSKENGGDEQSRTRTTIRDINSAIAAVTIMSRNVSCEIA